MERFRRASQIFLEVRRREPAEREAFVAQTCGEDHELRTEVERLLRGDMDDDDHNGQASAHDDPLNMDRVSEALREAAASALAEGAIAGGAPSLDALMLRCLDGSRPRRIGRYTIVRCLGEGGMGTVYEAQQEHPRRTVALKIIRPGLISRSMLRRFEHEAHVLGRLQHPGIAQIYEAGTDDTGEGAQPYFAMEYIDGQPLTKFAESRDLSTHERLRLLATICDAVEHAHQKGVIHRDLKPANILVQDDSRDKETKRRRDEAGPGTSSLRLSVSTSLAQPKILDFGVARAIDSDLQTTTLSTDVGQVIGTVSYMSPEQAAARSDELDTRSDVYALGVIAYELLSGRLPHDLRGRSIPEAMRLIAEAEPAPLSSLDRALRGDVATIVSKALEKEKSRRYQSAAELAADIRRYLRDEPIVARPATALYHLRKFARRNKALVAAAALVLLALVLGVIGTSIGMLHAQQRARTAARMNEYLKGMIAFLDPSEVKGREVTLQQVLDNASSRVAAELAGEPEVAAEVLTMIADGYRRLSLFDQAEAHGQQALELQSQVHGKHSMKAAEAWELLGYIRFEGARYAEAEQAMRAALSIRDLAGDEIDPRALIDLRDLIHLLQIQDRNADVESLMPRLAHLAQHPPQEISERAALSLHMIADMLAMQHRVDEAAPLYRQSIEVYRAVRGSAAPPEDYIVALRDFALLLELTQQWDEAEALDREALQLCRERFGPDHIETLRSINGLLGKLRAQHRLEEAETLAREGLVSARKLYGERSPDLAASLSNLAVMARARGQIDEAIDLFTQAADMWRQAETINEMELSRSLSGLGAALLDAGRLAEADEALRECLDIRLRIYPPEHPNIAMARSTLGAVLAEQGEFAQGETLLLEGWRVLEQTSTATPQIHQETLKRLVRLYERWGKPEQAAIYRERMER